MRYPKRLDKSKDAALTLPNLITVGRLLLVPLIILFISDGSFVSAFVVFVIAGISDGVDGFIARHYDLRSELGTYLDPIADKALLVSIYLSLALIDEMAGWLAVMVVSRDIFIIGGVILAWILERPIKVKPLIISKVNTAAQIILAAIVLGDLAFDAGLIDVRNILVWIVGVLTVGSAGAYLIDWVRHMANE